MAGTASADLLQRRSRRDSLHLAGQGRPEKTAGVRLSTRASAAVPRAAVGENEIRDHREARTLAGLKLARTRAVSCRDSTMQLSLHNPSSSQRPCAARGGARVAPEAPNSGEL